MWMEIWSWQLDHLEIVKIILEYAIDKNPEDKNSVTPLHYAAKEGHLEISAWEIDT
jgi:ankyrin repeat protein